MPIAPGYTVSDAVDALSAIDEDDDAPFIEDEKAKAEAATQDDGEATDEEIEAEADASTAEADDDQGDPNEASAEDGDDAEKDEPDQPAIDPPQFLDATERETFKALPRAAQEMILKHDKSLVADYTRKTQETAKQRKTLDARLEKIGEVLTEREQSLKEWDEVDWVELAGRVSAEEYNRYRAQMDKERREYAALRNTKAAEEAENLRSHNETELRTLAEIAPELADPREGPKRRGELIAYLRDNEGFDLDRLQWISARELAIAADARKWREHQASLKAQKAAPPKLKPKPDAKSAGKVVKPAARQITPSQAGRALANFRKKPTIEAARAALAELPDD